MSEYDIHQIESFLDGTMSPDERQAFHQRLTADDQLKAEIHFHAKMIKALKDGNPTMDKEELKTLWQEIRLESQSSRSLWTSWPVYLGVAAAIALFFVLVFPLAWQTSPEVDTYFSVYPMPVERGIIQAEAEGEKAFVEVLRAYQAEDFTTVIAHLPAVPDTLLDANQKRFYLGIAYYATQAYALAQVQFQSLLQAENQWDEHGRWYLALTYLQLGEPEKSVDLLTKIVRTDVHFQQAEAARLLDQLDQGR